MDQAARIEQLLKLVVFQNHQIQVAIQYLPLVLLHMKPDTDAAKKLLAVVTERTKEGKSLLESVLEGVNEAADLERETMHRQQSEAEKRMEEAMKAAMSKSPIGFNTP